MATPAFNSSALTAKLFYANRIATISGTGDAILTVAANHCVKLSTLALCNTSGSDTTVDVYVVPTGATAGDQHKIVTGYSLTGGDTLNLTGYVAGMMLGDGDKVWVKASVANVVNAVLTGVDGV
jgi:hypothetical protein